MESLLGKYVLISSENFDEYLRKTGVSYLVRKFANAATPVVEISNIDTEDCNTGEYRMKTMTAFRTVEVIFRLNEEFDETTADGRTFQTLFIIEDNKLIQYQKGAITSTKIERFIDSNGNLVMIMNCEDVKCTRIYRSQ